MMKPELRPLLYRVTLASEHFDRKLSLSVFATDVSEAITAAEQYARSSFFGVANFQSAEKIIPRWVDTDSTLHQPVMSREAYRYFGELLDKMEKTKEPT